jgi:hypothetical protein
MDANSKFSKFVAKLEQKMLDTNQESMILFSTTNSQIWGGSNGSGCVNAVSSCTGSINDRKCENQHDNCSGSINGKKCTNTLVIASM